MSGVNWALDAERPQTGLSTGVEGQRRVGAGLLIEKRKEGPHTVYLRMYYIVTGKTGEQERSHDFCKGGAEHNVNSPYDGQKGSF